MTVSSTITRVDYAGTGITGPYAFPFRIFAATDLQVVVRSAGGAETTLAYLSGFTLSAGAAGNRAGGTVTLVTALPADGSTLTIRRAMAILQPTEIRNQGTYFPETIEDMIDRLAMIDQQQQEQLDRSLKLNATLSSIGRAMTLNPSGGAGQAIVTDAAGGFTLASLSSGVVALPGNGRTVATLSAYLANNPVFNVRDFGALGNGVTDDTAKVQATLNAAVAAGGGIVRVPLGTYFLNSFYPAQTTYLLLLANAGAPVTVSIVCDPGTVLTTPLVSSASVETLRLSGNLENCSIIGGDWRNTHGLTANRSVAINAQGGASNTVKNLRVEWNVFRNHARTLHMEGVDRLAIVQNRFLFTNGRDSGSTNLAEPNVAIWCFANSANGQTANTSVLNNTFDGCTSGDVSANTNKCGLDGMVYGSSRGWVIFGNHIKHNGFEAIYTAARTGYDATRFPCTILGNVIDSTLPTGGVEQALGIRSDEHDTLVADNNIKGVSFGILVTGSVEVAPIEGAVVRNNKVSLVGATANQYGISVNTCTAPEVSDNRVLWTAQPNAASFLYGINVAICPNARVNDNSVRAPSLPGTGTLYGYYFQQTGGARCADNLAEFCTYGFFEFQHNVLLAGNRIDRFAGPSCTNLFGGATADTDSLVITGWENPMSADRGDTNVTLRGFDVPLQRFDTTLTANRTVTLQDIATVFQPAGKTFTIIRTGLGAFTLTVQDSASTVIKVIPSGTAARVQVMHNGVNPGWRIIGYELL